MVTSILFVEAVFDYLTHPHACTKSLLKAVSDLSFGNDKMINLKGDSDGN